MNKQLNRLGSYSAGNKEDNIFKVFAYLNTRNDYSPMLLENKTGVKVTTVLTYLRAIQKAQFFSDDYSRHLAKDFEEQSYSKATGEQKELAEKEYKRWQKDLLEVDEKWKENNTQLLQYVFNNNKNLTREVFYERLETSILLYSYLKKVRRKANK